MLGTPSPYSGNVANYNNSPVVVRYFPAKCSRTNVFYFANSLHCLLLSAVCGLLSAVCCVLSAVCCVLSDVQWRHRQLQQLTYHGHAPTVYLSFSVLLSVFSVVSLIPLCLSLRVNSIHSTLTQAIDRSPIKSMNRSRSPLKANKLCSPSKVQPLSHHCATTVTPL
jgi:hypothetical protein